MPSLPLSWSVMEVMEKVESRRRTFTLSCKYNDHQSSLTVSVVIMTHDLDQDQGQYIILIIITTTRMQRRRKQNFSLTCRRPSSMATGNPASSMGGFLNQVWKHSIFTKYPGTERISLPLWISWLNQSWLQNGWQSPTQTQNSKYHFNQLDVLIKRVADNAWSPNFLLETLW